MKLLVLNSGSSSQKSALFDLEPGTSDDPVLPLWEGKLQWDGDKEELHISSPSGRTRIDARKPMGRADRGTQVAR